MKYASIVVLLFWVTSISTYAQQADSTAAWQFIQGDQGMDIVTAEAYTGRLLVVRCFKRTMSAFVVWNEFVGPTPRVEYRIDEQAPKEQVWNSSSDGGASFYPGRVIELLKWMYAHDRLSAKVTPKGKPPITAIFDIAGVEKALEPLREACRWN